MADIAMLISYDDDGTKSILLDAINDTTVTAASTLTAHPIVTGDMVADHIFKEPVVMQISGTFSMNGGGKSVVISSGSAGLANVQSTFEALKDNGVLCSLSKITTVNKQIRFSLRDNMVLTNIVWTEKINSLEFTFTFTQVLLADVTTDTVDVSDVYLPSITEPATLSFTDTLLDWSLVDSAVIAISESTGLTSEEFMTYLRSLTADTLVALGVGTAVATALIIGLCASVPVVGWIIGGVAAVAIFVVGLVNTISSAVEANKYKLKQFEYYNNDRLNQEEVTRYSDFIGDIHTQLESLNTAIKVYQISSNESQECMLTIDNNYYIFTFTKNNTTGTYSLITTNIDETVMTSMSDVRAALTDFTQCNSQNKLFRADGSGSYVYLIFNNSDDGADMSDLTNYFILTSTINPEDFDAMLSDIIENAILY